MKDFKIIFFLCILNLMFFISQLMQMIFLRKINRTFNFPTISFFTDFLLFLMSILIIKWIATDILADVSVEGISNTEMQYRILINLTDSREFKFEYFLSGMITCLIWKVLEIVQFSSEIGPLVMIVQKMLGDFVNFVILYTIIVMMFAIVGNINFIFDLKEFDGVFQSCITVIDASIGNYDFELFKTINNNEFLTILGYFYIIAIVITFSILILNLIIAILSNTYNMFHTKSTGLYLSKILNARDDMSYDENYGAFLLVMAPLNIVVLPFAPLALFMKPSPRMNNILMVMQYSVFIILVCVIFMIGCVLMLPIAYFKSLSIKAQKLLLATSLRNKFLHLFKLVGFLAAGIPILTLNLVNDFYYFWLNNFRSELKKIIIERQNSDLTNDSIRQIIHYCEKYSYQKIKSVYTSEAVRSFRLKFNVILNLQYLMFGQFLEEGSNALSRVLGMGNTTNTAGK